jgi:hypothetical protein
VYCTTNVIRVTKSTGMRWAGHVARMGGRRGAYRVLLRRSEGRGPLGRPRHRWEDNIKNGLQQVGWGAVVNTVMKLRLHKIRGVSY